MNSSSLAWNEERARRRAALAWRRVESFSIPVIREGPGLYELMTVTNALRKQIVKSPDSVALRQLAIDSGMKSLLPMALFSSKMDHNRCRGSENDPSGLEAQSNPLPLFQYKAQNQEEQKSMSGMLEASDEKEAKERLRSQGLLLLSFGVKEKISERQNLRGELQATFTDQLAQLVNAGVPLYESLVTLEEQYRGENCHRVILSLSEEIKRGATLSSAMARFPSSFDSLYLAMIRAGESSGAFGLVLERLAELLRAKFRLKKQITTAMIYPAILGGFCLVVISVLVGFRCPFH